MLDARGSTVIPDQIIDEPLPAIHAWRQWLAKIGDQNAGLIRQIYIYTGPFRATLQIAVVKAEVSVQCGITFHDRRKLYSKEAKVAGIRKRAQQNIDDVVHMRPGALLAVKDVEDLSKAILRLVPHCCEHHPRLDPASVDYDFVSVGGCGCCKGIAKYIRRDDVVEELPPLQGLVLH